METTLVPYGSEHIQTSTNGHNESQAFKIVIFSPEKTRLMLGRDIPPEIYQQFVEGIRAVKDGGSFQVPARSEQEMALYKKKIREIANAGKVEDRVKVRFKDEIRRRHVIKDGQKTKEWVIRTNHNFVVYKASTGQVEASAELQKGKPKK